MLRVQRSDQRTMAVRLVGADEHPAIVLLHGWMVSGAVFGSIESMLPGYRLVIPDLRGAGESEDSAEGYEIELYAQDVLAALDELGVDSFGLVGHSMGGQVAQWIAASAPQRVRGMALLTPVPASGMALPDEIISLFRDSGSQRQSQAQILEMSCRLLSDDDRAAMLEDAATISPACIAASFDAWRQGGFADRLAAITAPTFVLATDDPFLPPEFLTQAVVEPIANARLGYLPGPGHYPQIERPHETAALLQAFFAGVGLV